MFGKTDIKTKKTGKTKKPLDKEVIVTIEFGKFYVYF